MQKKPLVNESIKNETYRFHTANSYTYKVAAITHALFIIFFYFLGVIPLALFNLISVAVLVIAYKLCLNNNEKTASALAIIEIVLHAAVATYYIGWETGYFYYLIGAVPLVSYNPETTKFQKLVQHIILASVYVLIKYYADTHTVIYSLDPLIIQLLYYSNSFTFIILLGFISYAYSFTAKTSEDKILLERQKADSANQSKSMFLANMSHELRTPLNAIIGYSELLYEDEKIQADAENANDIKTITQAGYHLLNLINNILDLSKVESGKVELEYQQIKLSTLLEEVEITITPLAKKEGNTLTVSLDKNIDLVCIDSTKIKQALINLLSNACKFTKNGSVMLKVFPHSNLEKTVSFVVSDTGIGIAKEKIPLLFQPFAQADLSTTRLYGGTGLGLTISKHFITLMKGDIEVESVLNQGTTFTVHIPVESEKCSE